MISILFLFFLLSNSISSEVIDSAGIFSKDTIEIANSKIQKVKEKAKKDLVIETFSDLNGKNSADYALEKAKERKVNGVYVLIAKKEKKIEVKVGNKTKELFGSSEMSNFKNKFTEEFKSKNFDNGLTKAVTYYEDIFISAVNEKPTQPFTPPQNVRAPKDTGFNISSLISSIIIMVIVGLIISVIIRLIMGLFNKNNGGGHQGGYNNGMNSGYSPGGGSWMGSFLTGMLGAAAGSWMYDRFFDKDNVSASGHDDYNSSESSSDSYSSSNSSSDDSPSWSDSDNGSDYSSDSSSWDSGSSGSDSSDW